MSGVGVSSKFTHSLTCKQNKVNQVMTNPKQDIDKWKNLPWKKFQRVVNRKQCRIYKARRNGNLQLVNKLQKLLLSSKAAKFLAIRQIIQLNSGKKTAGVDGTSTVSIKNRVKFAESINLKTWEHQKLRRVHIPKKNGKKRPLGIPTIYDRVCQCLVKYALEPACEAYFSKNSYGFRPGRSTHDVLHRTYNWLRAGKGGPKQDYKIYEMDIEKCFDSIDHKAMMSRVELPKWVKGKLWKAIKAGVKAEYSSAEKGTPQGGVISPLLANIALHGLEDLGNGLRYADDCIFILKPEDDTEDLRVKINGFLSERGLKVEESKTRLVKATEGFEFLGFKFLVLPDGRFKSYPTDKKHRELKAKVKEVIRDKKFKLEDRIKKVGSIVRGWRNYYQYCDMEKYNLWALNHSVWKFIRLEIRKNKKIANKRSWTNEKTKQAFPSVSWSQNRFVNVKGDASPFNGNLPYWAKRNSKLYNNHTARALKKQDFKCGHCGLSFLGDEVVELHHKDGNHNNWKASNLVALHKHCHQHQEIHSKSRAVK